jgi:hypothetical protein
MRHSLFQYSADSLRPPVYPFGWRIVDGGSSISKRYSGDNLTTFPANYAPPVEEEFAGNTLQAVGANATADLCI